MAASASQPGRKSRSPGPPRPEAGAAGGGAVAEVRPPGAAGSRRGRGRGRGRGPGSRRAPTWEISDSDGEAAEAPAGARRAAARVPRPERVLGSLVVCVDPAVLEDAGADVLLAALGALGCECRIEPQRPARSLQWRRGAPGPRAVPSELPAEDGPDLLLLLLEPHEFLRGAAQLTQASGLPSSVPWISPESPSRPHLAVIGLDAYLWSQHPSTQPEDPREAQQEAATGWPKVEEALVLLQLLADIDVLLVDSWQELSQHVCAFTKALAQRPCKQHRDTHTFAFCTAGRWASGQPVARDGSGLRGVWWRQIKQFNRVSPAVAEAIVAAFPSPRLLQEALSACSTEQERRGLLADLPVNVQGGRPRRVGPDLSRRICLFLSTTNPDLLLDLGC
ncbi:probable crossover junction endonuclease EME2 [Dipodomys merriami]|uniref:probable crossover junction endonuclease EME2 n=1 Tax=Dipodomys merriami TaxID=94247 RepID=UPI003855A4F3